MKATELITDLRAVLGDVQANGQSTIPIAGLEKYLAKMEEMANATDAAMVEATERASAKSQFKLEVWKVQAALHSAFTIEMSKSTNEAGQTALKAATLINGGAAAALLAFLGNLLTKQPPVGIHFPIAAISYAMLIFVIGLGLSVLAAGFRYFNALLGAMNQPKFANTANVISILLGLASLAAFFCGGVKSYMAIRAGG